MISGRPSPGRCIGILLTRTHSSSRLGMLCSLGYCLSSRPFACYITSTSLSTFDHIVGTKITFQFKISNQFKQNNVVIGFTPSNYFYVASGLMIWKTITCSGDTVEEKSTEIPADEDEKSDPVAASPNDPLLQVEQQEHLGEVEQHQKITSSNK